MPVSMRRGRRDPAVLVTLGHDELRAGIEEIQVLVGHRHRFIGRCFERLVQQRVDCRIVHRRVPEDLERAIKARRPRSRQTNAPDRVLRCPSHLPRTSWRYSPGPRTAESSLHRAVLRCRVNGAADPYCQACARRIPAAARATCERAVAPRVRKQPLRRSVEPGGNFFP